ncbi:hypothetical protein [Pseudomonas frederiksbergensis]|nr:hypothetical protein [Pseudomonas frederiksbergensis]
MSHDEAASFLASGVEAHIIAALVSIGLNEQDRVWAEAICLDRFNSDSEAVVASAITALGHIARRHGVLDMRTVLPALDAAEKNFPALEATVADTLDDIAMFT